MSDATPARGIGQHKVGTVVGKPGAKTVTILVQRLMEHPVYGRYIKRSKKFLAHDERDECTLGDTVEIVESRPLSARKRWRVRRIVSHGERAALAQAEAAAAAETEQA
ncbi:MAG: 30S ribosomal protein S17 [Acidobacteria bacterium]|nr:30S ribosomal protein S17 [Acidobacteriota bacterium]